MNINLEELYFIWNGGPGSGNHNPGQGRGVGKPSKKSKKISYEEYVDKFKKSTRSEKRELDKEYPEYSDKYFDELMGRHLKTLKREREQKELEEKFKTYEKDNSHPHFDLDNAVYEFKSALDISPDEYNGDWNEKEKRFEKLKSLKEYYNKNRDVEVKVYSVSPLEYSKIIIENNKNHDYKTMHDVMRRTSEEGIDMYVKKFEKGDRVEIPYIKFDKEGNYSGEQEGFHRTFAADRVNDKEIPIFVVQSYRGKKPQINYGRDITKDVENYYLHKNTNNNKISQSEITLNGGKGSGNHNPGQGRGVGKPANKVRKTIFTKDSSKSELNSKIMEIVSKSRLERSKILNGAKTPQDFKFGLADENSLKATKEQLDKINELDEKTKEEIGNLNAEFYKAKDNYTEPGFYRDSSGNVYEVVKEWGTVDQYSSDEYQKMYPIDSDRNRENEFFVSKYDKLEKISKVDAYMSLREGYTFGGLSSQEKRTIKSYTYATPQNSELRKGTKIEEIPSAMILQNVINRTKSERGTYYRGIRTEEGAKSLLNLKKGDIYVDKGFMSTDRNKDVAKNFATSKIMIEVNSKGGMGKSLSVSEFSMHPEENEVLFNAGTKMKIKDIVKEDGYTIYKVEVL